jgi:FlaA1/EpsC-like NDP-sugar epimerase
MGSVDVLCILVACYFILVLYPSSLSKLTTGAVLLHIALVTSCIFACRLALKVYRQIWRYAGSTEYIRLMAADFTAGWLYYALVGVFLPFYTRVSFVRAISLVALSLLFTLGTRFAYKFLREYAEKPRDDKKTPRGFHGFLYRWVSRGKTAWENLAEDLTDIAIVGAGSVGVILAGELKSNPNSRYRPRCFIDNSPEKIGREVAGIPVIPERAEAMDTLRRFSVSEVVFAVPSMPSERKMELFERYKRAGYRVKIYDFPMERASENGKRQLREFGIDELLFREPAEINDDEVLSFYRDKVVLVTGGGGSIGSELCRQIARMGPRQLVIVDIYENNAYDIQQELTLAHRGGLDLAVEIASVRDARKIDRIFGRYRPEIVLHAAAHKHVPLMECCGSEAIKNNIFGTLNVANAAEKYGALKFIMISTDKAVNPTNIMGASKRMCEMIVESRSGGRTSFSATRFGNVLGSNGSVIPLFKRQIAAGGPVTITDKRVIRYFMTIPEASQLVLQSGAMAKSGELFVLDMGKPVRVLDLAENMIRLTGLEPYRDIDIVEIGLRPGEKLYEEMLIKTACMGRTENDRIFVERDEPLSREEIDRRLTVLRLALETDDNAVIRKALMQVVPTYRSPEEVNSLAGEAEEVIEANARQEAV